MKHLFLSVSKFEVLVLSYLLTYFSHMRSIQHEYLEFGFLQTVPLWPFPLFISAFFSLSKPFQLRVYILVYKYVYIQDACKSM